MNWFRVHPITLALVIAIIIVLVGLFIVDSRRVVSPTGNSQSWGTMGTLIGSEPSVPNNPSQELPQPNETVDDTPLIIPAASSSIRTITSEAAVDFTALLAQIAGDKSKPEARATNALPDLIDAFSFLPTMPVIVKKSRTAEQEALYQYGNSLGRLIQSFDAGGQNTAQILNNQANNRTDPRANAAVRSIAQSYRAMGQRVASLAGVPESVKNYHSSLAEAYSDLATSLENVTESTEDQQFIAAITAHNKVADTFTSTYVGIATFFSVSGVTFSADDPGSVFAFSN